MKLIIISGTPKNDGLCHSLVTAAAEAAQSKGAETEIIKLSDHNLQSCKMCGDGWGVCRTQHRCAFGNEDGFNNIQEKYEEANAFVYITPVYWGDASEAMKIFLDKLRRCQATRRRNSETPTKSFHMEKPSILVASAGGGGGGITTTFVQMERAINHMDGLNWVWGGTYDYIAVNRWNKDYKRETLKQAVKALVAKGKHT